MSSTNNGQTLMKLVDIDRLLMQLESQLGSLSQRPKLVELAESLEQLSERSEQVAKLRLRQEMSIRALRDEDSMLKEKIAANQKQIEDNSDKYKEVVLLANEIDSLNKRSDKIDFDISELMGGIQKISDIEKQLASRADAIAERQDALTSALNENTERINEQIDKLSTQRSRLVALLPEALVARYDRQRELKQGIGAAILGGRICSACYIELSEGQLTKAKAELDESGIGVCPSCHRLLVL
ncbi:MAG: hypothetical protein FWD45_06635 [Coriobacteriia bacterium]|nr:hypothetical protein [Coriobacteriia bacterium]